MLDYGHLVVHVFHEEARAYYNLERLWSDAPSIAWEDGSGAGVGTELEALRANSS
ncbi:MAG: RsfS/YbeB/iojap family protein [Acidimicrobiales bacterium]